MKYARNIDYLVSAITYLGTHEFYWARSPSALARELALDEQRLSSVFEQFPGLFRKSQRTASNGQSFYALQARYAQRQGGDVADPEQISYIAPLGTDKLALLLEFVLKMSEIEFSDRRSQWTQWVPAGSAILAAIVAIIVAAIKV